MTYPRIDRRWRRAAAVAAVGYAVLSIMAAVTQAVLVNFAVATPEDLVHDVAQSRPAWVAAQVVLIAEQELLILVVLGFLAVIGRSRPDTVIGIVQLALAGVLFIVSGIFHGVFGVHIAALDVLAAADRADAVRLAELLHALGDTSYFIAIAATAIAMLALVPSIRRSPQLPNGLATLGLLAAFFEFAEFGWFLLPNLAYAAPVGAIAQACWFGWLGWCLWRRNPDVPASP